MSPRGEHTADSTEGAIKSAVSGAAEALLAVRKPDGFWLSPVSAGAAPEADYILLQLWLHPPGNGQWNPPARHLIDKAVRAIQRHQLPGGGFSFNPGGPAGLDPTIRAYAAMKLAGVRPDERSMASARETILRLGGLEAAGNSLKLQLSLFGLFPRHACDPATEAGPLSVLSRLGAERVLPAGFHLDELRTGSHEDHGSASFGDKLARWWNDHGIAAIRRPAMRAAAERILKSAGTWTSVVYATMSLDALGYPPEHPNRIAVGKHLNDLIDEAEDGTVFRPCMTPVRDTAIAAFALAQSGYGARLRQTGDWLRSRQVPSDTARVLLAVSNLPASNSVAPGNDVECLLAQQAKTGGWRAESGQTAPDTTGRTLEALCRHGLSASDPFAAKAIGYLFGAQEQDGSWYGAEGVNYIHGTFWTLRGLCAAGVSDREVPVLRAGEWLRSIQNADGGWGESCASYDEGAFVPAESTASQTAWAILGLLAGGDDTSLSVSNGIEYLLNAQRPDGTWQERQATVCDIPGVSYLNHQLYGNCFPLLALSGFLKTAPEVANG